MIRIGFSGARPPKIHTEENWKIWAHIQVVLEETIQDLSDDAVVVHGDAFGVDKLAKEFAEGRGLTTEAHPPDWNRYGPKRAPLIRNAYVTTCAILHAFPAPWSSGTWDALNKARAANVIIVDHSIRIWRRA